MSLLEVVISGTVGKQVVPTTKQAELNAAILTPNTSAALLVIRDGNASGEVVLTMRGVINTTRSTTRLKHKFTKGMHVKVLGGTATAYLDLS